jgi:hypothetical protein
MVRYWGLGAAGEAGVFYFGFWILDFGLFLSTTI